jgi:hypothetical protein
MHGQFSTTESGELEHSPKGYISEQKLNISHARFEKPQIFEVLDQRIREQHILSLSPGVEVSHCGVNRGADDLFAQLNASRDKTRRLEKQAFKNLLGAVKSNENIRFSFGNRPI